MSILIALVGVTATRFTGYHDNGAPPRPMASQRQQRRICTELCASGLGGEPCGEACLEKSPRNLPLLQSNSSVRDAETSTVTRRDACDVLCENRLGYPLCGCDDTAFQRAVGDDEVDFVSVCSFFCINYDYQIDGCQSCQVYKDVANNISIMNIRKLTSSKTDVDWEEWCKEMCTAGDGGIACNCDILPINAEIDAV